MSFIDKLWTSDPGDKADDSAKQKPEPLVPVRMVPRPPTQLPPSSGAWPSPSNPLDPASHDRFKPQAMQQRPQVVAIGDQLVNSSDFLDHLRAKTDFDSTDIGKKVKHEMAPLETLGNSVTESQKIAVVLKAGVEDGITGQAIVQTYDDMLKQLDLEKQAFDSTITQATLDHVTTPSQAVDKLRAQVEQLQQQIIDTSLQVSESQVKIQSHTTQFSAAYIQRKAELQQAQAHYSQIIQEIH